MLEQFTLLSARRSRGCHVAFNLCSTTSERCCQLQRVETNAARQRSRSKLETRKRRGAAPTETWGPVLTDMDAQNRKTRTTM